MYSDLYVRTNFTNTDIDYIFNSEIREYDLRRAGLSLIKQFNLLPQSKIDSLSMMDKVACNKEIGMLQKDKQFADKLLECFAEARRLFFETNEIQTSEIVSIKKDAIFVHRKKCDNTVFGELNFRVKNQYLGYLRLNRIEFYYKDPNTVLDVKGLGPSVYLYHTDYMLDFIKDVISMAIYSPRNVLVKFVTDFIKDYRKRNLMYGYYRQMDGSNFHVVIDDEVGRMNVLDVDDNEDLTLDITYNYCNYLIPIAAIFVG